MTSTPEAKASCVQKFPEGVLFTSLSLQGVWIKHCLENKLTISVCHICTLLTGGCTLVLFPLT